MKKKVLTFFSFYLFLSIPIFSYPQLNNNLNGKRTPLKWEHVSENKFSNKIIWESLNSTEILNNNFEEKGLSNLKNNLNIKSIGRSVTVNLIAYPEISNYVPNAFVNDSNKKFTLSLRGISKVRNCGGNNIFSNCNDGILDIDYNLINYENFSFNTKITIQSLSNRRNGTKIGEASSLGFKAAKYFSPKLSIALGGENIIHFDSKSDLGRNFYLIGSTFYSLNKKKDPSILFLNAGIGSDFYGYKGNGYLAKTKCFGTPNLTGDGENFCSWGPIASLALALNSRFAFINEWFGYGYGTGIAVRPFKDKTISLSLYATDFINNFPKYIQDGCPNNNCSARLYGSLSFSF